MQVSPYLGQQVEGYEEAVNMAAGEESKTSYTHGTEEFARIIAKAESFRAETTENVVSVFFCRIYPITKSSIAKY